MDRSYSEIFRPGDPEFWKNLWFYNKKIIISVLVAVLIVIYTVSSCVSKPEADAGVVIVTRSSRTAEATGKLKNSFSRVISDINGDGKITVDITEVYVPVVGSDELDTANSTKAVNEIINGEASVIIAEKALIENFFDEVEFFSQPPEGKYPVYRVEGMAVAVDITSSPVAGLMQYGGGDRLYLMVKSAPSDKKMLEEYGQGMEIARLIVSE